MSDEVTTDDVQFIQVEELSLETWKELVDCYIECRADHKRTHEMFESRGYRISRKTILAFIHEGDEHKGLPPVHQIYKDSVEKAVSVVRADAAKRMESTLQIVDAYKYALLLKIQELTKDPRQVTNLIGGELRNINKVESDILEVTESQERLKGEKSAYAKMSLGQARQVAQENRKALERAAPRLLVEPVEVVDGDTQDVKPKSVDSEVLDDDPDYGLEAVMARSSSRAKRDE
jgi:hypothetical protein